MQNIPKHQSGLQANQAKKKGKESRFWGRGVLKSGVGVQF